MLIQDILNLSDGTYDLGNQTIKPAGQETGYWVAEMPLSIYDLVNLANNAEGYLGSWLDPDTGNRDIDLTHHFTDRDKAKDYGRRWNQKAIWDIEADKPIYL
jgi:hypothetical protein